MPGLLCSESPLVAAALAAPSSTQVLSLLPLVGDVLDLTSLSTQVLALP